MATVGNSQILVTEARIEQLQRRIGFCTDLNLRMSLERDLKEAQERLDVKRKVHADRIN